MRRAWELLKTSKQTSQQIEISDAFQAKIGSCPVRKYYHPIETLTSPATQANKSHNKNFQVLDLNQTLEKKERRYYTTKDLTLVYFKLLIQVTAKLMKMLVRSEAFTGAYFSQVTRVEGLNVIKS